MKYLIAALLLLGLVAVACGGGDDDDGSSGDGACPPPGATAVPASDDADDESASPDESDEATTVPIVTEDPGPTQDPAEVFQIDSPESGDDVSSPITVRGLAAVFEAEFKVAVLDEDGTHIVDDLPARSAEGQTLSPFEVQVPFYVDETTDACLQLYEISARDGSRVNVIQLPITLIAAETPGAPTSASASP